MSLNQLKSRLIHASNTYPEWIKKVKLDEILRKGEIGFEELLDTLKISIDKVTVADKIWAIKLTFGEGKVAILANFEKTDESRADWLASVIEGFDDNMEFHYIPVEQDLLKWSALSETDTFLGEKFTILSTNNGYDVEIIFNDTPHLVEAGSQNTKVIITEVTSYVRNDVNAEGVNAEYQHYQFINYRMKVGDGLRAYESLPYFGSVSISTGSGSTSGGTFTGIVYQSEITDFDGLSDEELIAQVTSTSTPHNGDLFVINRRINDQYTVDEQVISAHVEKTAYSYNGTTWIALDGNYDARNVFFHEDITITKDFGIHTSVTSSKVLSAKGRSLYQFLAENLASEDKEVKKSAPKVTASTSALYNKTTETTPTAQVTFTASTTNPSYEYGVKSGDGSIGTFSDFKVTYDGTTQDLTGKTYTITPAANTTHGHTKSYTMSAAYTEGTEKPLTNLGNVIESQRYTSTTCSTSSAIYARYYTPLIAIKLDTQLTANDLTAVKLANIISDKLENTVKVSLGSYASQLDYTAKAQFENTLPTVINGNNSSYKSIIIAVPTEYKKGLTGKKFAQDSKVPVGASVTDVTVTVGGKSYLVTAFTNAATVSFEIIIS